MSNSDVQLHSPASVFAIKAHDCKRYGRKPYDYHLTQVVMNYPRFRDWDEVQQHIIDACWLHDYLEDCVAVQHHETELGSLGGLYGAHCAEIVRAVTNVRDPSTGKGVPNYKLIRATSGALTVKLCDRIANVENCVSYKRLGRAPHKFFKRYVDLYPTFKAELRGRCRGEGAAETFMWEQLDMLLEGAKGPFE